MKFTIMGQKLLGISVCSDARDEEFDELTRQVNAECPCGTENGWTISTRAEVAPIKCADDPTCRHFIFDC